MIRREKDIGVLWQVLTPWLAQYFELLFQHFETGKRGYTMVGKVVVGCWLLFALLMLQPRIGRVESWRLPLVLFPHINFSRPRWFDPLRIVVQIVWLVFVRQQGVRRSGRSARQYFRFANLRSRKLMFKLVALFRLVVRRLERVADNRSRRSVQSPQSNDGTQWRRRDTALVLGIVLLALLCITVPFSLQAQFAFVLFLMIATILLRQIPGRFTAMLMIVLSLVVSCRYIWWRSTNTLNWDDGLGLLLGLLLMAAELYAFLVLLLGYFQNIWPLHRGPELLPDNQALWPSVDIFIPSYNEDLEVVRATVYACMGMDWPQEKMKIHILDDGKRDSFRDFAAQVGVNYIRRPVNNHAKAGNINYALTKTDGEYVAIFDCDHIPIRAFLQVCMGSLMKDPKLALVQTPHHFYSPDPFERNLSNFRKIPNECNLFYGLIQDGNDLWNAAFFCGSCAVLRRTALEEVGGIAVETVTEDAHTSLRMHRRGYRSAYLRAPISAGLATETLSAHIGQRIRWARGMAQILRTDNPLTGPGLKWHQRLCYFNAMLHFLSGIPRLIFLTAPLIFLLMHTYIIYAPASLLLMYVIPHMFHASVVNSVLQGKYRYSFWGEVYESVLAWYVARPTTVALFAPHKGTFNVTAKGGKVESFYYDWVISKPYVLLVCLNVAGLIWGVARIFTGPQDEVGAVVINMVWTAYNLLILGAAVAVAGEVKQVRAAPRVEVNNPVTIRLKSGHTISAHLRDFSLGGLRLALPDTGLLRGETEFQVIMPRARQEFLFPVKLVYSGEKIVGLRLAELTTEELVNFVQCTFARADNWVQWQQSYEEDQPGVSFVQVFAAGMRGFRRLMELGPMPLPQIMAILASLSRSMLSLKPQRIALAAIE